jgi:hypothetical protein
MANIYVNHTGSSTPPYDTEAKAATRIQVALDAAYGEDVILIKADQDYVMNGTDQQAAQFDVDNVNLNSVTIKGYYLSSGDQDFGGAYYKDPNHGWVIIDANNGNYNVFGNVANVSGLAWKNIKTINVNTAYSPFYIFPGSAQRGHIFQNLFLTGGKWGLFLDRLRNFVIMNCEFTGSFGTVSGEAVIRTASNVTGNMIMRDCLFAITNTHRVVSIGATVQGFDISNNIFNISGTVVDCIYTANEGVIANNVIYENSGGAITNGIKYSAINRGSAVFNSIIVGCTKSIDDPATYINFGGWNCFYNNGSDWTLRVGDIVADPQFMNAANGDFRLKPTSPCLNTGKQTLNSGYTDIGTWQRKSLLR